MSSLGRAINHAVVQDKNFREDEPRHVSLEACRMASAEYGFALRHNRNQMPRLLNREQSRLRRPEGYLSIGSSSGK